jgi:hypothetical protein
MANEILPETRLKFLNFIKLQKDFIPKSRFVKDAGISLSTVDSLIDEFERAGLIEVRRYKRFTFVGPIKQKGGNRHGRL